MNEDTLVKDVMDDMANLQKATKVVLRYVSDLIVENNELKAYFFLGRGFSCLVSGWQNQKMLTSNSDSVQKITPRTGFSGLESKIQVQKWSN